MKNLFRFLLIGLIFSGLLSLIACGKKGPPLPPEDLSPQRISSIRAEGSVSSLDLRWRAPQTTVSGSRLDDLDGFKLRRAIVRDGEPGNSVVIANIRYLTEAGTSGLGRDYIYRDRDVQPGVTYDYTLTAENKQGYEGETSQVIRVLFKGRASEIENIRE